ncbi:c-type cytochrome [Svornostia abyssi]|uniref:C-type cytochrome n=1 Tax=Svornostia abyssi TaxID=2898438 RepID=A0ABY5PEU2_9ACTN|nr:c-type cytochrome [Parviterribacteraceae bacterium J379]
MRIRLGRRGAPGLTAVCAMVLALGMSACGSGGEQPADLVAGKQQFVAKCGSCHVLNRAETKGVTGPNLDDAFRQGLADGMNRQTVRGTVYDQILYPAAVAKDSPAYMPPKLVEGRDAVNVAAYIAAVTGKPGKDTGALANAIKPAGTGKPAVAKDGLLSIAADPGGQLAYVTDKATAPPGPLDIESPNESSVDHNIALELDSGDEIGNIVKDGGVSKISVDVDPGTYTFYCSVPGHREGGMEGELTVKE